MRKGTIFQHSNSFAFIAFALLFLNKPAVAQTNFWYTGKVVQSKGSCTWLIRITSTNDTTFLGKLIEPTSDFPEAFKKRGTHLRFEMHPLRQPVPAGCRANVVASIVNPIKD